MKSALKIILNDIEIAYKLYNFQIKYRIFNFCVGETVGEKSLGIFVYQFQAQNQNAKSQPVFDRWNLYMHVFYISCKLA